MKKKPYCIIPNYISIPELNYRDDWAYATLKEAQADAKSRWDSEIYKFIFKTHDNAVTCKLCKK